MKDMLDNNAPLRKSNLDEIEGLLRGRIDSANEVLNISTTEVPRNVNETGNENVLVNLKIDTVKRIVSLYQ